MQTNWSLILNIVLLASVIIAIFCMLKSRRVNNSYQMRVKTPPLVATEAPVIDDIVSVRKITPDVVEAKSFGPSVQPALNVSQTSKEPARESNPSIMMFLLAKDNRQLAGYELLQTVLAAGLRFGEGQIFHRHQYPNGQGPVLCSLAAATETGTFDLQNIGAFTVRGLCLFMQASGNATIDGERFEIMLDTARLLSEGLDTYLLDDKRKPLTDLSVARYCSSLGLTEVPQVYEEEMINE